jgi:hypothetical protein
MKIQNGGCIQNVYIVHPIFSKMITCHFLFSLGKTETFKGKLFLENSKWRHNLISKMKLFKKIKKNYISGYAE